MFPNLCPGANVAFLAETSDVLFKFNFIFYYLLRQRQANRQIGLFRILTVGLDLT